MTKTDQAPICEPGGKGLVLPFSQSEHDLPNAFRGIVYAVLLVYCFLGVSIVADTFMGSIEAVTSRRRQVRLSNGRIMTVRIWNDTVANLTLMALGSSAPEIMLSIIELLSNGMYAGDLGPSTIVGSAAFNLLIIMAVCVVVIPANESRKIQLVSVFYVTMVFSLFAYLWLVLILQVITPDVVDTIEAVLTLLFLPLLVYTSYLADVGTISFGKTRRRSIRVRMADGSTQDLDDYVLNLCKVMGFTDAESSAEVKRVVTSNPNYQSVDADFILDEHVKTHIQEIEGLVRETQQRCKSRAQRRIEATRAFTGGKKSDDDKPRKRAGSQDSSASCDSTVRDVVHFLNADQSMSRDVAKKPIAVTRTGDLASQVAVYWSLHVYDSCDEDKVVSEKEAASGVVTFMRGQPKADILVSRPHVSADQPEDFVIRLNRAEAVGGGLEPQISLPNVATVSVVPAGSAGRLVFFTENMVIQGLPVCQTMQVFVHRCDGCSGQVGCSYHTEKLSAVPGYDYEEAEGEIKFEEGVTEQVIDLLILPKTKHEVTDQFLLVMNEPTGGAEFDANDDGGEEQAILTITIKALQDVAGFTSSRLMRIVDFCCNVDELRRGTWDWIDQFPGAIYCNGSSEEQAEAVVMDWVFHIVSLPWKILFTLVPPTSYCGGWVCFYASLVFIALITAVIGDLAALFGCVLYVPDSVTAITFVALGTSMPDLFASQTAAAQDPWADASICNVTGSNSVNVFLGLGLPWTMAALYWTTAPWDDEWAERYSDIIAKRDLGSESMSFVVPAGSFGFSVSAFCCTALVALALLNLRRRAFGAELGGPPQPKIATSICFAVLWLGYIILASWQVVRGDLWDSLEVVCVVGSVLVLNVVFTAMCVFSTFQHYGWRADEDTDSPGRDERARAASEQSAASTLISDKGNEPTSLEELLVQAKYSSPTEGSAVLAQDSSPPELGSVEAKPSPVPISTPVEAEPVFDTRAPAADEVAAPVVASPVCEQPSPKDQVAAANTQPVVLDLATPQESPAAASTDSAAAVARPEDTTGTAPLPVVAVVPLVNVPNSSKHVATKAEHETGVWSPARRRRMLSPERAVATSPQAPSPRGTSPNVANGGTSPSGANGLTVGPPFVAQTPKPSVVRGTARSPSPASSGAGSRTASRTPKALLLQL